MRESTLRSEITGEIRKENSQIGKYDVSIIRDRSTKKESQSEKGYDD